jgi:hypothetical protein
MEINEDVFLRRVYHNAALIAIELLDNPCGGRCFIGNRNVADHSKMLVESAQKPEEE